MQGIHPSFNHNHDRLTALLRLAEDKHGADFADRLGIDLKQEMVGYAKKQGVKVADFTGIVYRESEKLRLEKELNGNLSPFEGIVADEWQQKFDVELVRFDPNIHKVLTYNTKTNTPKSADYAIVDLTMDPKNWVTIDLLFAMSEKQANDMAYQIFESKKKRHANAWDNLVKTIDEHLLKADIVPMDLHTLDVRIAAKIIAYMLSLPKEKQKQIIFIVR